MLWNDLFAAVALLLVFEGMMPFVNPNRWRYVLRLVTDQPDSTLRIMGLFSMLVGATLMYLVR